MSKGPSTLYEARRTGTAGGSPGTRSLRLPIGVLLVAALVIGGGGYGLWFLGYTAGLRAAEQQQMEAAHAPSRTADPLALQAPAVHPPLPQATPGPAATAPGIALGPPPEGDPRRGGLNYFILADGIQADRAQEMASFCRGQGLDAVAVPSNNARFLVFVQPGFGWEDRGEPAVKALEASIRSVGAQWKALGRGNGDFRDFYPKLFKGPT